MPFGLHIVPADGGKIINFTANLKAAGYLGNYRPALDNNGRTTSNSSLSPDAQLFVIPRSTGIIFQYPGSAVTNTIFCNNISISGGTVTCSYTNFNSFNDPGRTPINYDTFQIIGSQRQGFGLFLQDSTNFFSITNSTIIGQCTYRATVNINGSFQLPSSIPNLANAVVFANWNRGDRALYLDRSNMSINVYNEDSGPPNQGGDCTVNIVVISNTQHEPHNGGLTLWNPDTGNVAFSSKRPPFIYRGVGVQLNQQPGVYTGIGNGISSPMIPLCSVGGQKSNNPVGTFWQIFNCGLKMQNNSVTGWRCNQVGNHSVNGANFGNVVSPITLPVIDAADYF